MSVTLHPHLYFDGRSRDAVTRYQQVLGGTLSITSFGDLGMDGDPDKVLSAELTTPDGLRLTAGDVTDGSPARTGGSLSVSGDDEHRLRGWFDSLAQGGDVHMPFEPAAWGGTFGQCADEFGVTWLVHCEPAADQPGPRVTPPGPR